MKANRRIIAWEDFICVEGLARAMASLYQVAVDESISLIGLDQDAVRVDGCMHRLQLVECFLENGTSQFNLEAL